MCIRDRIDVLKNDHAGPDAQEEKLSYSIESVGGTISEKGAIVLPHSTKGVFQYTPPIDFLGEDNFQYRLIDQNFSVVGKVKVWVSTSASSPEWTSLYYFGTFYKDPKNLKSNWIFHTDIGWVFVDQPDQILDATWMWRENLGWFWTCLLYTSPSPRDLSTSRMPSSA